jgi:hypothetical protein
MSEIKQLKEKRDHYYQELEELHMYEPNQDWYLMRRNEIECEIAFIEEAIDILEKNNSFENKLFILLPFVIVAIVTLIILLWS